MPYVVVCGVPKQALIQLVRRPEEVLTGQAAGLRLNANYYISKQLIPPLDRVFSLMGVDVREWWVREWREWPCLLMGVDVREWWWWVWFGWPPWLEGWAWFGKDLPGVCGAKRWGG